jgi:hypothetical protein
MRTKADVRWPLWIYGFTPRPLVILERASPETMHPLHPPSSARSRAWHTGATKQLLPCMSLLQRKGGGGGPTDLPDVGQISDRFFANWPRQPASWPANP